MSANCWGHCGFVRFSFLDFLFYMKLKMELNNWKTCASVVLEMFTFHILKILFLSSSFSREK